MGKTTRVIFLDIDGVLNDHTPVVGNYCGINRRPARNFCRLLNRNTQVVISSAWRYMVHGGAMTIEGFRYMLATHGIFANILGVTPTDETVLSRADQIMFTIYEHKISRFVVLDDLDLGLSEKFGNRFVKVNGKRGLTMWDVKRAAKVLRSQPNDR